MKKVLLAALPAVFLFFSSCSKDEEAAQPSPAPAEKACRPTVVKEATAQTKQAEYIYENHTRLTRLNLFLPSGNVASYSLYDYRNDGQIQKINNYSGSGTLQSYQVYAYNTDNTLNRITDHAQTGGNMYRTGFTEFEYSGGRISKKFYFEDANPDQAASMLQFTYDSRGNVTRAEQYIHQNTTLTLAATVVYQYDNKKNFSKNLGLPKSHPDNISPNNITKATYKNQSGTVIPSMSRNYIYTYNADNYPVSLKMENFDGQVLSNQLMEYHCN